MMTGMSAPPIGMIRVTPMTSASTVISTSDSRLPVMAKCTASAMVSAPMTALSRCWPANLTGAPESSPWSLPKAMTEPVKVMAPITTPAEISPIRTAFS